VVFVLTHSHHVNNDLSVYYCNCCCKTLYVLWKSRLISVIFVTFSTETRTKSYILLTYFVCFVCLFFFKRNTATAVVPDATPAGPEGQYHMAFMHTCRLCENVDLICIVPQSMPSTVVITATQV